MGNVGQVESSAASAVYESAQTEQAAQEQKKTRVSGRTIGEPQLSENAAKYYEELKRKYGGMDFILVSSEMKELAKQQAGQYANPNRMVVLIDEEKIERMAEDEEYRKQYEGIISSSAVQMEMMKSRLNSASNVKTYGIQVNDGGNASFFAVIDKSLAAQRERIADKKEKAAADKKASAKKDAKKAAEEKRMEKAGERRKADRAKEEVVVTAPTMEDLLRKIEDENYAGLSDSVWSDQERMVGQSIDFRG